MIPLISCSTLSWTTWTGAGDGRLEHQCRQHRLQPEYRGLPQVPRLNMLSLLVPSPLPTLHLLIRDEFLWRAAHRVLVWLRQEQVTVERRRPPREDSGARRQLDPSAHDTARYSGLIAAEHPNYDGHREATAQVHMI
jgi:hypothetical protein